MKLSVAAIGLMKAGPEKQLAEDYQQRIPTIGRQAGITGFLAQEWAESRAATADLRKAEEARRLWQDTPASATVIALDERGKSLASADFARLLEAEARVGTRDLVFMIGGPDGHAPETRSRASRTLSFGPMTFPHRLLRVMLLEQLYRAVTILVNHPYHRV
jgi:23S rRNA (pseudouridine1915-N3)-methyltransferase